MPEAIISASGTQYGAAVDETNRLLVRTEGITVGSLSIAAGSESYIKNWGEIGSDRTISNLVAGSIVYMPAVSVTAGSEQWIQNFDEVGSVVYQGDRFGVSGIVDISNRVAGSIVNMPKTEIFGSGTFSVTGDFSTGSEVYVKEMPKTEVEVSGVPSVIGSVFVSNQISEVTVGSESYVKNWNEIGSSRVVTNLYAGSKAYQGDRYGVSGIVEVSNRVAGSIVNIPSVTINSPATIGSYTTQSVLGSVAVTSPINVSTGSNVYIKGGSVEVHTGSIYVTNFSAGTGYAGSDVWQGTDPWIILGSVHQVNTSPATITGSLEVFSNTGSVEIYGALSAEAGSESYIKGGSIEVYTGSIHVTNFEAGTGYAGSDVYIKAGSVIITNTVETAGSIVSLPDITVDNLYAGSKFYQGDRFGVSGIVEVSNRVAGSIVNLPTVIGVSGTGFANVVGSVRAQVVQATSPWQIAGSIYSMPNITTGSNVWVKGGSISVFNRVAGSIVNMPGIVGSVQIDGGSIYVTNFEAGTGYAGSDAYIPAGSVIVTNTVTGSIISMPEVTVGSVITGSESWIKGGSVELYNLGSNAWVYLNSGTSYVNVPSGSVQVNAGSIYVTNFEAGTGYAGSDVWQGTDPWIILGSVHQVNTSPATITGSLEVFSSTGSVEVYGSLSATAGSEQWIKNELTLSNVGSPCFKQATAISSGTYTQVWSIGGGGSRLEIHSFDISTNLPGIVKIVGSATAPNLISCYYLNFSSGATVSRTFVSPIIPTAADIHVGFQTTSAGSTAVTIYGREVA